MIQLFNIVNASFSDNYVRRKSDCRRDERFRYQSAEVTAVRSFTPSCAAMLKIASLSRRNLTEIPGALA